MKTVTIVAIPLLFLSSVCGQQEESANVASQEDVLLLQKEIERLRHNVDAAEKRSMYQNAEDQKRFEASQAALKMAEQNLAKRLEAIEREARNASDNQLRTRRIVWFVTWGAVLFGIFLVSVLLHAARKITTNRRTAIPFVVKENEGPLLADPDIPTLKQFSVGNNGIRKIPFVLTLQNGTKVNCIAELRDGLSPLVYIEKEKTPVAWDKRRQFAAKVAGLQAS
jgi:hypothetical protein